MSVLGQLGLKAIPVPLQGRFEVIGGQLVGMSDNANGYIKEGYNVNDIIYSVINLILDKISIAPWAVYEIVDESSLKQLRAIQRKTMHGEDRKRAEKLFSKALQPVNAGKWSDLLKYPNADQTFQEFVCYAIGFKMLTGNGFVWANLLDAGTRAGLPGELWVMYSQNMMIKATTGFPPRVTGYQNYSGQWKDYPVEQVMHFKYPNFSGWDNSTQLWGFAPLKSACLLTNRDNSALKASTAKFQNGGLQHVLYIDEPNLTQGDRDGAADMMNELKKKLVQEYTGPENTGKVAGSNYRIGAVNLGLSPADLQIIEAEKWDMRRFCNIFGGVPSQLLNDPDNKVYSNMKEGEVSLTTRGALPQMVNFRDGLNRKAHDNWGLPPNQLIDYDTTYYTELQDDVKEMAGWVIPVAQQTGLSPNRILDLLGLETIDDDYYNQPRVLQQMGESKEEYDANIVDQTLNNNGEAGNTPAPGKA